MVSRDSSELFPGSKLSFEPNGFSVISSIILYHVINKYIMLYSIEESQLLSHQVTMVIVCHSYIYPIDIATNRALKMHEYYSTCYCLYIPLSCKISIPASRLGYTSVWMGTLFPRL